MSIAMAAASSGEEMTVDEWFKKNGMKATFQNLGGSSWAQNYKYEKWGVEGRGGWRLER